MNNTKISNKAVPCWLRVPKFGKYLRTFSTGDGFAREVRVLAQNKNPQVKLAVFYAFFGVRKVAKLAFSFRPTTTWREVRDVLSRVLKQTTGRDVEAFRVTNGLDRTYFQLEGRTDRPFDAVQHNATLFVEGVRFKSRLAE